MAKILITGITGFIGAELKIQFESAGHNVFGISSSVSSEKCFLCDLRNRKLVAEVILKIEPDIVIHAAGLASVTKGESIDYYEHNVLTNENVLLALDLLKGRKRFVFLSTAAVYGNQPTDILHEELIPLPVSHYGMSKYVCERMVNMASEKHDITNLRLFNLIGSGQNTDFIVAKLIEHYHKKASSIQLGNIDTIRDYLDINTAVDRIVALTFNHKSFGETINLCSGIGYSIRDMLLILDELAQYSIAVEQVAGLMRKAEVWNLLGSVEKFKFISDRPFVAKPLQVILSEMMSSK